MIGTPHVGAIHLPHPPLRDAHGQQMQGSCIRPRKIHQGRFLRAWIFLLVHLVEKSAAQVLRPVQEEY